MQQLEISTRGLLDNCDSLKYNIKEIIFSSCIYYIQYHRHCIQKIPGPQVGGHALAENNKGDYVLFSQEKQEKKGLQNKADNRTATK